MRSPSSVFTLLVCFVFGFSILVSAQSATTSLHGTVSDSKGAVVSGAAVTITDNQTGFSRSVKTSSDGEYQFLQLPPATYVVTVAAPGFATIKQEGVRLMVSTPATLNFTVAVQGQTVTIEVAGTAPLVNTTDATLGHAFGTEKLESLPFEGRDPVGILSLQPGVVFIAPKSNTQVNEGQDSRGGAVNGARSDQTNVTLDGVDNNDQLQGLAFVGAVRATLDSLQEFRVTTSNSNADAGRSSGAQVSLVTKSGTNHFHGSAYEYNRSKIGEANDWFNKKSQLDSGLPNVPPHLVRNTFGATVGGPVVKDRLFFFLAYEGQRTHENQQITRIVPSDDLRNGIVNYLACSLPVPDPGHPERCQDGDPLQTITLQPKDLGLMDPNCTANGTCPLGPGANSAVEAIFKQYPSPNTDSVGDGLNYRGFTFSAPAPAKLDTYIAKIDFNLTQNGNHRVFVRGGLNNDHGAEPNESVSQTGDAGPEFPGLPTNLVGLNNSKALTFGYTALLRNNLINNFRYGFIRQGLANVGLKNQHFVHFRGLDNPLGFDTSDNTHVPVHNFVDDVSWTKGKHNLQFGGNVRRVDNIRTSNGTSFFTASTNVSWLDNAAIANTGSSLDPVAFNHPAVAESFSSSYDSPVSALAGLVTEVDANYNLTKTLSALPEGAFVPRHFRASEFEFYGQDAWRVTPNFTLTLGARYSLLQPPYETTGTQVAPSVSLHDWFNKRGQAMLAGQTYAPLVQFNLSGQANGKQPYWAWDYKDLAPRIAIAWSPSSDSGILHKLFGGAGKTSIRAGYGIYFDHFGEGITNSFDRLGSFGLTTSISNSAAVQDVDTSARFSDLFTIPSVSAQTTSDCPVSPCSIVAPAPTGTFPVTPPTTAFAITWGLDDKLKTPYSHVIDFSITRELPHGFVVEASYVGRMAHRLLQEEDLAMPLDIVDPASKMDYFAAATALSKAAVAGTDINSLSPIPYWENLVPGAAGQLGFGPPGHAGNLGCAPGDNKNATNYTATQAMYDMFSCFTGNETTALFVLDLLCLPACSQLAGQSAGGQPFNFFDNQWSSLYAWRSVGNSAYHAAQLSLRHLMKHGLQFDLNYTLSKSIDVGSNAERINQFEGGGFASQIINSWSPNQLRAVSDFDTRHQINSNWVYELPFGNGKAYASGMSRWANALVGGWQFSGLLRWSSGLPFTASPGLGFWATNWELTSSAVMNGPRPKTGTFLVNGQPNVFKDPATAIGSFRFAFPGESGQRNNMIGPGIFGLDTGLGKSWKITESQALKFAWEVFNATNSVRFDAATANVQISQSSSFGNFIKTLSEKRVMQFSLRYSF